MARTVASHKPPFVGRCAAQRLTGAIGFDRYKNAGERDEAAHTRPTLSAFPQPSPNVGEVIRT